MSEKRGRPIMSEPSKHKKRPLWLIKDSTSAALDDIVVWMIAIKKIKTIYRYNAIRLLIKAWESLTETQKKKLLEGE